VWIHFRLTFEHPLDFKYGRRGWIAVSSEPKTGSDISAERKKRGSGESSEHTVAIGFFRQHIYKCVLVSCQDTHELEKLLILNIKFGAYFMCGRAAVAIFLTSKCYFAFLWCSVTYKSRNDFFWIIKFGAYFMWGRAAVAILLTSKRYFAFLWCAVTYKSRNYLSWILNLERILCGSI